MDNLCTRMKQTSHSRCEAFRCPLQGYFKHIAHMPPAPRFKDYAFTGSYVHTSIDPWFNQCRELGDDLQTLADVPARFTQLMDEIYRKRCDTILDPTDDDAITLCLNNFIDFMVRRWRMLKNLGMLNNFLPIFVEKEFKSIINGVPFHGFLDVGFRDSKLWLFDWKTNKDGHISETYIKQATRYALLVEDDLGPITEFYMINLRRKVDLNKARIVITDEMKQAQRVEIKVLWDIMNGTSFPKDTSNCGFCDYKMLCLAYPNTGAVIVEAVTGAGCDDWL